MDGVRTSETCKRRRRVAMHLENSSRSVRRASSQYISPGGSLKPHQRKGYCIRSRDIVVQIDIEWIVAGCIANEWKRGRAFFPQPQTKRTGKLVCRKSVRDGLFVVATVSMDIIYNC